MDAGNVKALDRAVKIVAANEGEWVGTRLYAESWQEHAEGGLYFRVRENRVGFADFEVSEAEFQDSPWRCAEEVASRIRGIAGVLVPEARGL